MIKTSPPKTTTKKGTMGANVNTKKRGLHLISVKEFEKKMTEGSSIWILAIKKIHEEPQIEYP